MPPRLPQSTAGRLKLERVVSNRAKTAQCLICSFSQAKRPLLQRKPTSRTSFNRAQSTAATPVDSVPRQSSSSQRAELRLALQDLERHARSYVNLSRLQLALRGLEQSPGQETIRIGILGVGSQRKTASTTRELVRLLVADPLKEEEEWERQLTASSDGRPIILKIGKETNDAIHMATGRLIEELHVSSPLLNSHNLEILLLQSDAIGEDILVPTVEIPSSNTRYTPVTTPVHMAVVVAEGIMGVASLVNVPGNPNVLPAIDIPGQSQENIPFDVIDTALAGRALASFRHSVDNAMTYEHEWFQSGLPNILDFVKSSAVSNGGLKAPLQTLILSLLADSSARISASETQQLAVLLSKHVSSSSLESLNRDLRTWAERSHTELRDTLETAFAGSRWSKLGWWKLFWRVDDVSMISSDILLQRFLPDAEKEIIYLAGKIDEAGVIRSFNLGSETAANWAYKPEVPDQGVVALGTVAPSPKLSELVDKFDAEVPIKAHPWPLHIPIARTYLLLDTVPALQALAQKLVLQTLSTSGLATVFSALIYVADTTTGIYEAGAVAALGIVWSLRRMQTKWERAREFWEGEVREEGRRAIRSVEGSVENVLKSPILGEIEGRGDLEAAKKAVERVERALTKVVESK